MSTINVCLEQRLQQKKKIEKEKKERPACCFDNIFQHEQSLSTAIFHVTMSLSLYRFTNEVMDQRTTPALNITSLMYKFITKIGKK